MRKISPWGKEAKNALTNLDLSMTQLAVDLGMHRSYVSSVINGRVYSEQAAQKISEKLGISYDSYVREVL